MVIAMAAGKGKSDRLALASMTAASFMLAIGSFTNPASAQTCQELEQELASIPAGIHVLPVGANKKSSGIAAYRSQLMHIEDKFELAECRDRTVKNNDHCTNLYTDRQTIQAELAEMEAHEVAVTSQRGRIFAQMRDAGCPQAASFRQTVAGATGSRGSIMYLGSNRRAPTDPAGQSGFSVVAGSYRAAEVPTKPVSSDEAVTNAVAENEGGLAVETSVVPVNSDIALATGPEREDESMTPSVATMPARLERRVRVVGPRFLPDPEEAIDLQVQGRDRAR